MQLCTQLKWMGTKETEFGPMTFELQSYLLAGALLLPIKLWILHGTLELVTLSRVAYSYFFLFFFGLFLFSPIFRVKPPIFPIFLAGEGKKL